MATTLYTLQALVAASIFFVWVVRYDNIIHEFRCYALPDWLRDIVGICKLTLALLLVLGIDRSPLALVGGAGMAFLMVCAFVVHLRVNTPWAKRLPCLSLFTVSLAIALIHQLQLVH
ncbi:MAG: hypothetical protein FJ406_13390 [Verrucomicrobia bacterium]|nr:hypothetical protein [Verrucomicrobiota bacterium]